MSETDKETILSAIQTLSERIDGSFSEIRQSLTDIEQRLGMQENKSRRIAEQQSLQEKDIEELKRIVLDLARREPIKVRSDGVAISKERAYRRFREKGIGKVTAKRALRDAGVLAADAQGQISIVVWDCGRPVRVLLVREARA